MMPVCCAKATKTRVKVVPRGERRFLPSEIKYHEVPWYVTMGVLGLLVGKVLTFSKVVASIDDPHCKKNKAVCNVRAVPVLFVAKLDTGYAVSYHGDVAELLAMQTQALSTLPNSSAINM